MDIQQRVQVLIGGDASQAKKVIKEVEAELKASQARARSNAGQVGKQTGDQFGKAFSTAQDRWLRVAENSFRTYGGKIGRIIGDIIGSFDKVSKAQEATRNLPMGRGATSVGGGAASEAGGSFVGDYLATRLAVQGTGIAKARRTVGDKLFRWFNGKDLLTMRRAQRAERAGERKYRQSTAAIYDLKNASNDRELRLRAIKETESTIAKYKRSGVPYNEDDIFQNIHQRYITDRNRKIGELTFNSAMAEESWGNALRNKKAMEASIAARRTSGLGRFIYGLRFGFRGASSFALGGAVGGIGGALGISSAMSSAREDKMEKRSQLNEMDLTIQEIEKIGNSTERTRAILAKFGADGQKEFRKLKDDAKALREELASKDWDVALETSFTVWKSFKEFVNNIWQPIKGFIGKGVSGVMGWAGGISQQDVDEINAGNKAVAEAQANLDAKRAAKAKEKDEADKKATETEKENKRLAEQINSEKDKTLETLRDLIPLEKQQKELEMIVKFFGEKKNRTLEEELNYRKAINQLAGVDAKLNEQSANAAERRRDALERQYNELNRRSIAIDDASRYSLGELAGTESGAGMAARRVQSLEQSAKQARLSGNHSLADALINQANSIRSELGAAGITTSNEFGDMFPITPTGGGGGDRALNAIMMQQGVLRFGDRVGYGALKQAGLQRIAQMRSGRHEMTLDSYFAAHGELPVKVLIGKPK